VFLKKRISLCMCLMLVALSIISVYGKGVVSEASEGVRVSLGNGTTSTQGKFKMSDNILLNVSWDSKQQSFSFCVPKEFVLNNDCNFPLKRKGRLLGEADIDSSSNIVNVKLNEPIKRGNFHFNVKLNPKVWGENDQKFIDICGGTLNVSSLPEGKPSQKEMIFSWGKYISKKDILVNVRLNSACQYLEKVTLIIESEDANRFKNLELRKNLQERTPVATYHDGLKSIYLGDLDTMYNLTLDALVQKPLSSQNKLVFCLFSNGELIEKSELLQIDKTEGSFINE
jgi:hypothetical protein